MARIRTIKPEFWTDSFMVQLPPLARLIYISLWTAADDHGLIPDEPERLAMEVMPREDGLVFDDWFQFFEASGRLERLYADGQSYYRIAKWESHQRVDKPGKSRISREGSRKIAIPLPVRRQVAEKYSCAPGESVDAECFYCGAPGQVHWHRLFSGRPSGWVTFPGLELDHANPEADGGETSIENIVLACRQCNRSKGKTGWIEFLCRANSIPVPEFFAKAREDSGTEQGTGNREGKEQEPIGSSASDKSDAPPKRSDPIPYQAIVDGYNGTMTALAKVREVTPKRRTLIRAAWQASPQRRTLAFWTAYWAECADDPFLCGDGPYREPHANWRPTFDYLLRADVVTRVFEAAMTRMERES